MTTECICCGKQLDETLAEGRYLSCKKCNRLTPLGSNSETRKYKSKIKKGGKIGFSKRGKKSLSLCRR